MTENREKYKGLAIRIYDLDQAVYKALGSNLGSVFNGGRDDTIRKLAFYLLTHPQSHLLRSDIALIGNMARTVRDKEERARLMAEHQAILAEIAKIPSSFGSVDIVDSDMAQLNLSFKKKPEDHLIICISRSHGSAGTDIGFALSENLKINYYDEEVLNTMLRQRDNVKLEKTMFEQNVKDFTRFHGLSRRDAMFFKQSDLICELSKKEDMIIMGRCADAVLAGRHIPHISIYITAPLQARVQHIMTLKDMDLKDALKRIRKSDHQHEKYYNTFTGMKWGNANNYDLCINSARYGIAESVELIKRLVAKHTGEEI
jgi:cytidylate kinase